MKHPPSQIQYLNTDLVLVCSQDLTPLASALDALGVAPLAVVQGDDGRSYATLEIRDDVSPDKPENTIAVMLAALEALDHAGQALWAACSTREFNIGYDCGDEPWAYNDGLDNATLQRMASLGASLRITIYPYREP